MGRVLMAGAGPWAGCVVCDGGYDVGQRSKSQMRRPRNAGLAHDGIARAREAKAASLGTRVLYIRYDTSSVIDDMGRNDSRRPRGYVVRWGYAYCMTIDTCDIAASGQGVVDR